MSLFTKTDAINLLDLKKREHDILAQILKLTEDQAGFLAADDIEGFDKSLSSRQQLIEGIDRLHQESDGLMQSYISYSESPEGTKIRDIEELRRQIRDLLEKCSIQNERNAAAAKEILQGYTDRINELNISKKGIQSYIQTVESNSELIDKTT